MRLRERIVEATGRVVRERGLVGTTTKVIAREAGCAEGSIYNHFEDRRELLATAAECCLPNSGFVREFPGLAGNRTVRANLEEFARVALETFLETVPLWAAVLADPEILAAHRRNAGGQRSGLETAYEALAAYVEVEQRVGRVDSSVDAQAVAELLVGACHSRAFLRGFESDPDVSDEQFVEKLVAALMIGLATQSEK